MKHIFAVLMASAVVLCSQENPDKTGTRPLTEAEKVIVADHSKEQRANFVTACLTVTRDVARKKLAIYAVKRPKVRAAKVGEFDVEVLFHPELAKEHKEVSGAYYVHHNSLVLTFAGAEFAAGKKNFAVALIEKLVEANPEMWWSTPEHPNMWVKDILSGLKKNDDSIRQFLKIETDDWKYRVETYRQ